MARQAIQDHCGSNQSSYLFRSTSEKPRLHKVTNPTINKLIGIEFDGRLMKINTIRDDDVRFVSMVIVYKVYQLNILNLVFDTAIHVAYRMVKEDSHYDLCIMLLE